VGGAHYVKLPYDFVTKKIQMVQNSSFRENLQKIGDCNSKSDDAIMETMT